MPHPLLLAPTGQLSERQLAERERILHNERIRINNEMYGIQVARASMPRKQDAATTTEDLCRRAEASLNTDERRGPNDAVHFALQTDPVVIPLSRVLGLFQSIGIGVVDDVRPAAQPPPASDALKP